jgi:hypothetical protein
MSFWRGALLFFAMALLFLTANRGAYKGYFNDDDMDNLVQTRQAAWSEFGSAVVSPKISAFNFRPMGHAYYKVLGAWAGLNYRPYVAVLHGIHLLNVWLVWLLLRRMGAGVLPAAAGSLLFAFHMACFDGYWKPMFVFDVACATWVLLCLLLYLRGNWVLALIPYWLAYKTKEPAIALPVVLLAHEYILGERRWRRVVPFAVIAASFALQAIVGNRGSDNDYTLRFTLPAVWKTFRFYSSQILLLPYAGVLLLGLALLVKDRRARFGLLCIALFLGPLWFLPGRLFAVYLYVPLIGAAVAMAFLTETWKPVYVAAFFAVWIPFNYYWLREQRRAALTVAFENRPYVEAVGAYLPRQQGLRAVLYDGGPTGMNNWGMEGAIRWYQPDLAVQICPLNDPKAAEYLRGENLSVLSWDRARRRLIAATRRGGEPDPASIVMDTGNPVWLFGEGWYPLEGGFRWIGPEAKVRLRRPAGAREFFVRLNLGPVQQQEQGSVELEALVNGRTMGARTYKTVGWVEQRWEAPTDLPETVEVTLRVARPYKPSNGDPRLLGAAVTALGFAE